MGLQHFVPQHFLSSLTASVYLTKIRYIKELNWQKVESRLEF